MDLREIQDKLNLMLTGNGRKLVFWYDDDASYEENIRDFALAEGVKLWIVTDNNWFETKLQMEVRDPDSSYLIYAPFPRPDDRIISRICFIIRSTSIRTSWCRSWEISEFLHPVRMR